MISAPSPLSRFQFSPSQQISREENITRSAEGNIQPVDYYYQKRRQKPLGHKIERKKKENAMKYSNYSNQTLEPILAEDYQRFSSEKYTKVNSRSHSSVEVLPQDKNQSISGDQWKKCEARWKKFERQRLKPSKSLKNFDDISSPLNSAGKSLSKTKTPSRIQQNHKAQQIYPRQSQSKSYVNLQQDIKVESRVGGRSQPNFRKYHTDVGRKYENGRNSKYSGYTIKEDHDRFSFGPIRETPTLEEQDSSSFWNSSRHPDSQIQGAQGLQNKYSYSSQRYPLQTHKHFKLTLKPCPSDTYASTKDRGGSRSSIKYQASDYSIHTPSRFTLAEGHSASSYQKYERPMKGESQNREELHSLISELRGQLNYYEQQVKNMERESRYFP